MKKTFKTMLALMAGAMVFTACSNDGIIENNKEQDPSALKLMTFTASMEGEEGTRTTIDGADIKWSEGDEISVFCDAVENAVNNAGWTFTLKSGAGTTTGTFEGHAPEAETCYYALYPSTNEERVPSRAEAEFAADGELGDLYGYFIGYLYLQHLTPGEALEALKSDMTQKNIPEEDQKIILAYLGEYPITLPNNVTRDGDQFKNVVLPHVQNIETGKYVDQSAMLMIAKSNDAKTLSFKNACAYVKVTPAFDCDEIILTSKGSEKLAGTVTLDYNNGQPTATVTDDGVYEVKLKGNISSDVSYYIAVLPATLAKGFTITFLEKEHPYNYYEKTTNKSLTLARNSVIDLGIFSTDNLKKVENTGSVEATGIGKVNWIQLWPNGPKFAECNVGVTAEQKDPTSYGGYYCWGGEIDQDPEHKFNEIQGNLTGADDTATKLWGENWRMPTSAELQGLIDNCTYEWIDGVNKKYNDKEGVEGALYSGRGSVYGKCQIFIPAAGIFKQKNTGENYIDGEGLYADCWSSTWHETSDPEFNRYNAKYLHNIDNTVFYHDIDGTACAVGISVRAVLK